MARIDNAEAIRDRAYAIWEREGRPSGREHEHWAEAAHDIESAQLAEFEGDTTTLVSSANQEETRSQEMERLRRALYEPAEFAEEPLSDEPFLTEPANDTRAPKKPGRRATR